MTININQQLTNFVSNSVFKNEICKFSLEQFLQQQIAKNSQFKGFVLFFYPKDNSKCCIAEVQSFASLYADFVTNNVEIIGISRDSTKSHQNFAIKQNIPFPILSDETEQICNIFDVIVPKTIFGKKVIGIERSTFFISADGKLLQQWRKVKTPGHAEAVLNFVKTLQSL